MRQLVNGGAPDATQLHITGAQTTEQPEPQFRADADFWHKSGMGLGHDFKAGVNFINEPRLFITFNSMKGAAADAR